MTTRPVFDLAGIYRTAQEGLLELAPSLDESQRATRVPTCPAWTVQDTYAHLAGLAADAIAGVPGRLGSDDNTMRQVATRRSLTLDEICEEWARHGDAMGAFIVDNGYPALAIDAWTHRQDIVNALGMQMGRHGPGLELTISGVWRLKRRFREADLAGLRIITDAEDWLISDGNPAATLRIDRYELARALLGRRSRRQMLAYDWDGDPEPYVTMLPAFDPPETDIVE